MKALFFFRIMIITGTIFFQAMVYTNVGTIIIIPIITPIIIIIIISLI